MKKITTYLGIALILFCSCSGENKKANRTKSLSIDSLSTPIASEESDGITQIPLFEKCTNYDNRLSTVATEVEFISLETNSNCLLTDGITGIELTDEYIFIAEIGKVSQFDRKGNFIRRIGQTGRGPQEYIGVSAMQIDKENRLIYILSGKLHGKLLVFNFDGKFIRNIHGNGIEYDFDLLDDGLIAIHCDALERLQKGYKKLLFKDSLGNYINSHSSNIFPELTDGRKVHCFGPSRNWTWQYLDKLFFLEFGNDTIFQFEKMNLTPRFVLNGDQKLPALDLLLSKQGTDLGDKIFLTDEAILNDNSAIFESDNLLLFRCRSRNVNYFIVFNKQTKQFHSTLQENTPRKRRWTILPMTRFQV